MTLRTVFIEIPFIEVYKPERNNDGGYEKRHIMTKGVLFGVVVSTEKERKEEGQDTVDTNRR